MYKFSTSQPGGTFTSSISGHFLPTVYLQGPLPSSPDQIGELFPISHTGVIALSRLHPSTLLSPARFVEII